MATTCCRRPAEPRQVGGGGRGHKPRRGALQPHWRHGRKLGRRIRCVAQRATQPGAWRSEHTARTRWKGAHIREGTSCDDRIHDDDRQTKNHLATSNELRMRIQDFPGVNIWRLKRQSVASSFEYSILFPVKSTSLLVCHIIT